MLIAPVTGTTAIEPPSSGNAMLDLIRPDWGRGGELMSRVVEFRKDEDVFMGTGADALIYFPIDLLMSLRSVLVNGSTAEFSQVGHEGIVGFMALVNADPGASSAVALTSGRAYRFRVQRIRQAFDQTGDFRRGILTYMAGHMLESAQRISCAKYHSALQQVCRTILLGADRLGSETIRFTHEQLAQAIGCRREAVSLAAARLQSLGWIRYAYGRIEIVDRAALEKASCECYSAIRQGFGHLLDHI